MDKNFQNVLFLEGKGTTCCRYCSSIIWTTVAVKFVSKSKTQNNTFWNVAHLKNISEALEILKSVENKNSVRTGLS